MNKLGESNNASVGIVGAGKLGKTLAHALSHNHSLAWVVCRNNNAKSELFQHVHHTTPVYSDISDIDNLPTIIILCVPDSQIGHVAKQVSFHFQSKLLGALVLHCSGLYGAAPLQPCADYGARTAAAHPFQTFAGKTAAALHGSVWGIECLPPDEQDIRNFITEQLRGISVILNDNTRKKKAIYHASAVAASNIVSSAVNLANKLAIDADIDPRLFLPPIVHTAMENSLLALKNNDFPLTGPIVRGDVETIKTHLASMTEFPEIRAAFASMNLAVYYLAKKNFAIENPQIETLLREAALHK